jgi:hypothetical protein
MSSQRVSQAAEQAGECAVDLVGVARRREMGLQAQRLRGLGHFRHQIADSGFAESAGSSNEARPTAYSVGRINAAVRSC